MSRYMLGTRKLWFTCQSICQTFPYTILCYVSLEIFTLKNMMLVFHAFLTTVLIFYFIVVVGPFFGTRINAK